MKILIDTLAVFGCVALPVFWCFAAWYNRQHRGIE